MRVLNKRYWPCQVIIKDTKKNSVDEYLQLVHERKVWCLSNLADKSWVNFSGDSRSVFAFKLEEDLLAFKLRWQ